MSRVNVHLLDDMQNAPFAVPEYAAKLPVDLTSIEEADLVVGRKKSMFDTNGYGADKKQLLWTHEPFFDTTPSFRVPNFFSDAVRDRTLYVFNVHNGLVYTDNYYLAPRAGRIADVAVEADLNVPFADKTLSFAATYKLARCMVEGTDRSLNTRRCELALELHGQGRLQVIGRDWPEGVAQSESRFVDRGRSKTAFLKSSNFNLCYENCDADYYITEKLWESIFGGCLPIYWPNETLYLNFPRDSFIDGRAFENTADLMAFVDAMSFDEYRRRINLCRHEFVNAVQERRRDMSRARSLRRLISFLDSLIREKKARLADAA